MRSWSRRRPGGSSAIKATIREYHQTKGEEAKKALEEANALFPFVFSRAWMELQAGEGPIVGPDGRERTRRRPRPSVPDAEAPTAPEVVYPLDPALRERVLEIERMMDELTATSSGYASRAARTTS